MGGEAEMGSILNPASCLAPGERGWAIQKAAAAAGSQALPSAPPARDGPPRR